MRKNLIILNNQRNSNHKINVLIIGDGDTSELFIRAATRESNSPYNVVAILGIKKKSVGNQIHGIPVIGDIGDFDNLNKWIEKNSADPLQPDLTEVVSKRESVSLLLSMLDCFFPYMQQTEKLKDKPYFSDQISDDGLWEMKQIKDI